MINIAVMGYGTVGSGVVEVLRRNSQVINDRVGEELRVKYVLDLRGFPGDPVEEILIHEFDTIVNDPEIAIVVEVMGGLKPAYEFTKASLKAGKSVCTSNKELVQKHGAELIKIAAENNCNYLFEASVGGGIPIIRPINSCLTAEEFDEITGIINGTTNYILSKMFFEGAEYGDVLRDAQKKGYAELHPEADVEGFDACRKISILSSLVTGKQVDFEDVPTEGITKISADDMKYAHLMEKQIKLFATSRKMGDTRAVMVAPFMIGREHPLYGVNDVFNAIMVRGNMLGEAMFYGQGAGKLPTASAVVSDVVESAKHLGKNIPVKWSEEKLALADAGSIKSRFFVRIRGDRSDLNEMQKIFSELQKTFGQVEIVDAGVSGEFGFVTDVITGNEFNEQIRKIDKVIHWIRVEA